MYNITLDGIKRYKDKKHGFVIESDREGEANFYMTIGGKEAAEGGTFELRPE